MRRTITGFSNPTVKFLRSLRDKKHRRIERCFLAEGLRLLTDARETGRIPEMLVMAEGRDPHPLLDALEADMEVYLAAAKEARGNNNREDVKTFTEAPERIGALMARIRKLADID